MDIFMDIVRISWSFAGWCRVRDLLVSEKVKSTVTKYFIGQFSEILPDGNEVVTKL
jgi:hypothetical protein